MEEKLTLQDLSKSGKTYWRFSQSEKGRSQESCFAEYLPGHITVAETGEKLSFVSEDTIALCFMYGDKLTKLNFDISNKDFQTISDYEVEYIGLVFGEYRSEKLLTEEEYSLEDLDAIKLMFSMIKGDWQISRIFNYKNCDGDGFVEFLKKFGFDESASMVSYLKKEFEENIYISKEEIMDLIEKYITGKIRLKI